MKVIGGFIVFLFIFGIIPLIPYLASVYGWTTVLVSGLLFAMYLTYRSEKKAAEAKAKE
jgi:glucose-6-phosphate-specific signal transduction histidine kinase